jgi:toxin-antitoxin system PIN domain toxin
MKMPDVNILVYAHRAEDPAHAFYRDWLEEVVNGPAPFGLSVLVASAFVRIVTHPRFRPIPSELEQAIAFVEAVATAPAARVVGAGWTHWQLVRDLCRKTQSRGALISDAQHAAVAIEHGCTWVSRDQDFERFKPHGLTFELLEPEAPTRAAKAVQ